MGFEGVIVPNAFAARADAELTRQTLISFSALATSLVCPF